MSSAKVATINPYAELLRQGAQHEAIVLGSMLIDPDVCAEAIDLLQDSDFGSERNQLLFAGIREMYRAGKPADMVTVGLELDSRIPGCLTYTSKLAEVPTSAVWEHHAKQMQESAARRDALLAIEKAKTDILTPGAYLPEVIDRLQGGILTIGDKSTCETAESSSAFMAGALDHYRKIDRGEVKPGIQTGFGMLDRLTGGLMDDIYCILAARPKQGKTALMMDLADNIARDGHKVGIFSCEMSKRALRDRWISKRSGVSTVALRDSEGIRRNMDAIVKAADQIAKLPMLIDASGAMSIGELKRRARKMVRAGAEILFIDQASWIRGEGKDKFAQQGHVSNEIAALKKELHIPIVLLCQINRDSEKTGDPRPTKSDLKNSGAFEEDADIIMLLHRPWVYFEHNEKYLKAHPECTPDFANLELVQREGPCANIPLSFNERSTRFKEKSNANDR